MVRSIGVMMLAACAPSPLYEAVGEEFSQRYALFDVHGVDWPAAQAEHAPPPNPRDDALYEAVTGLLGVLPDNHIQLLTPDRDPWTPGPLQGAVHHDFHPDVAAAYLEEEVIGHPRIRGGWLDTQVAYVWMGRLDAQTADRLDDFMHTHAQATGIVLDLRDDTGGYHRDMERVAAWFVDQPCDYSRIRRRSGPEPTDFSAWQTFDVAPRADATGASLAVLTNQFTISGAENLLLALRCRADRRVFGDTTAGAFGARVWRDLPGAWLVSVTVDDVRDADGASLEGVGFVPDEPVSADFEDLLAGRDPALERAWAWLGG